MKYDVFISYSRRDYVDHEIPIPDNIIDKLLILFDKEEISYWIDKKGIYSSDKFMDKICEAIDESYLLVFVSTEESHKSDWTPKELIYANNNGHPIIPLELGTAPKKGRVAFFLNDFDRIFINESGEENTFQRLIESIHKKLDELDPNRKIIRRLKEQQKGLRDVIKQKEQERKTIIERLANHGVEVEYESVCNSGRLVELRKEIEAKKAELEAKNAELSEKNKQIEKQNVSLRSLEKDLSETKAANDAAKRDIDELKKIIGKLESEKRQLQVDADKFRALESNTLWFDDDKCALHYKYFLYSLIKVEGGTFTMGATQEQGDDVSNREKPAHKVTLSTYRMGRTAVPQWLWVAVMGNNPSNWKGDNLPVENVSWNDCQDFINKLNRITGQRFHLPTEAQWEFAARGGNKSRGYKYSGSNGCGCVAWYYNNSEGKTHEVGTKQANELGLYDMSGNVLEWCSDWYGSYNNDSVTDPIGPTSGSNRVFRGGSWDYSAGFCRVALRCGFTPGFRIDDLGFRLAL